MRAITTRDYDWEERCLDAVEGCMETADRLGAYKAILPLLKAAHKDSAQLSDRAEDVWARLVTLDLVTEIGEVSEPSNRMAEAQCPPAEIQGWKERS